MTINMINLEREANSLSHTYTHTRQDGITTALRAHSFFLAVDIFINIILSRSSGFVGKTLLKCNYYEEH